MEIRKGHSLHNSSLVCKFHKSNHSLKQASRLRFDKLASGLLDLGFTQTVTDYSLFVYNLDCVFVAALVDVDDIIFICNKTNFIVHVKGVLHTTFTTIHLGLTKYFLGSEMHRTQY